jgi:hypothetical protein
MNRGNLEQYSKPEVTITLNGKKARDWIEFEVKQSITGEIDNFRIVLPWDAGDNPRDEMLSSGRTQSSFLVHGMADVAVTININGQNVRLIEGKMDSAVWNFTKNWGETVVLLGRCKAASAHDMRQKQRYQNMTATEAHAQIAAEHGLTPVQPVKTTTFIGAYDGEDHCAISKEMSHWDYINYLAQNNNFITRVEGGNWYFGPESEYRIKEPLSFSWGHNILNLQFKRAPNAARNLVVEIRSWHNNTRIVERASFNNGGHEYVRREHIPDITRAKAQEIARSRLAWYARQQMCGSFTTVYAPEISLDRNITLYGVGFGLSRTYSVTGLRIAGNAGGITAEVDFSNAEGV